MGVIEFLGPAGVYIITAVIGLLFGSFLNCVAMRIVRKQNWVTDRSSCPDCGHVLGALDLIPVLSYLLSGGKCRHCGKKISARYPLTELVFMILSVLTVSRFGVSINTIRYFILLCSLFVLTLTDIEDRLIPNGCLIIALVGWFVTEPFLFEGWSDFAVHIAAMIAPALAVLFLSMIMDILLKKPSMGGGDVKLIGVLGLYLGIFGTMFMLTGACVLGLLYALLVKKLKRGQAIAFGPFLSASGFLMALYGEPLVKWYIGMM